MKRAYYKTKFGVVEIIYDGDTLFSLKIVTSSNSLDEKNEFTDYIYSQLDEYFRGYRKQFNIKYYFCGTDFQKRVWKEIEKIPYGKTITYLEIAKKVNSPKSVRAVGTACGKNPIWIVVPCHRVIGKNNKLTGYAGGLNMKKELLEMERKEEGVDKYE